MHSHTIKVTWEFYNQDAFAAGDPSYTTMDILGCPDSSVCPLYTHEDWDELWDDGSVDDFLADVLNQHQHNTECKRPGGDLRCVSAVSDSERVVRDSEVGYVFQPQGV